MQFDLTAGDGIIVQQKQSQYNTTQSYSTLTDMLVVHTDVQITTTLLITDLFFMLHKLCLQWVAMPAADLGKLVLSWPPWMDRPTQTHRKRIGPILCSQHPHDTVK